MVTSAASPAAVDKFSVASSGSIISTFGVITIELCSLLSKSISKAISVLIIFSCALQRTCFTASILSRATVKSSPIRITYAFCLTSPSV